MILEEFAEEMAKLTKFFGKKLDEIQARHWFEMMRHLSSAAFATAISAAIMRERYFPTPKIIFDLATNYVEERAKEKNKTFPTARDITQISAKDSEYTRDAKEIFRKSAYGELTGFDLADAMFDMDKKYPGKGWDENAKEVFKNAADHSGVKTPHDLQPSPHGHRVTVEACSVPGCQAKGTMSPNLGKTSFWVCQEHWGNV